MKVLKFGGTSVGTAKSLASVKRIVEQSVASGEQLIVVVSALGGITDQLIATARLASQGDMRYLQLYAQIVERHLDIVEEVVMDDFKAKIKSRVNSILEELGNVFYAINLLRDLSSRTLDMVVSFGERMSSLIISRMIADARYLYSPEFIITRQQFGKHILDSEETSIRVHEAIDSLDFKVAVAPGFIASDRNGDITNLGRGGSDYTAAIIASLLKADILEIWTDVDGFMTADPRIVKGAYVMDCMTFGEAMELCNFGAKVIYPPTLYPVYHKNIPIVVKNTFNAEAPGTLISATQVKDTQSVGGVRGISSVKDVGLISIGAADEATIVSLEERIFNSLAQNGISILFMTTQRMEGVEELDYSHPSRQIVVKADDLKLTRELLAKEFSPEMRSRAISNLRSIEGLSLVAAVGGGVRRQIEDFNALVERLESGSLTLIAHNAGESETNISMVCRSEALTEVLNSTHKAFFGC